MTTITTSSQNCCATSNIAATTTFVDPICGMCVEGGPGSHHMEHEGTTYYLKQLLNDTVYAEKLGRNGREHIKNNFLITRHLRDYLLLFISLDYPDGIIYLK